MIRGKVRLGRKTKDLTRNLAHREIAVLDHPDLDELAARSLVEKRVAAVINAAPSITGRYPNRGPLVLVEAGIRLVDGIGPDIFGRLRDGDEVRLEGAQVYRGDRLIATGRVLDVDEVRKSLAEAEGGFRDELRRFLANTLDYAEREQDFILNPLNLPRLRTPITGRPVLVVVRGHDYKEDLRTLRAFISEFRPAMIAVDGGADALLENGFRPDLVVGDMDSVSDEALKSGAELVVHGYPGGGAPGLVRVKGLGLQAGVVAAPGTSEDLALLLAYESGATMIVAVGTHTHPIDFLEKGRKGMASTFLVRLKVGPILVDAKGVNRLYRARIPAGYVADLVLAALIPTAVILGLTPAVRSLVKLWLIHLRLLLGS